ncbi:GAF domain-containing protein [Streptomyces rishiriensis]|uniref:GAF domain-containing protein n=1 Tax=Streptomyces rishiriensis TaxID=68264 RepID=UPI0037B09A82
MTSSPTPPALPQTPPPAGQHLNLLRSLGLGAPDPEFDLIAKELAEAAGVPYAMVNLFHPITGEQLFVGLETPTDAALPAVGRNMPGNHGFCPEVVRRRKALVLPDVFAHPRFAGNPVVDRIGIRTYAGAPLIHEPSDTVIGTVCFVGTSALPLSTGKHSLELIKERRDELMDLVMRRAGHTAP